MGGQTNGITDEDKKKIREPSKLVLCFDGTGNAFSGTESDTNIVKLYQKFDRTAPNQYHYYQPGIGTYVAGEASLNAGVLGRFKRSVSQKVDEGIGTSFDQHVIAGYRFIMKYYAHNAHITDKIYIFGFSRGAFTARFLARMISEIGLLSRGNEEMVPFAYKAYQDSQIKYGPELDEEHNKFMKSFKTTFCRSAKVHFLGLFDTVNSVGVFDVPFKRGKELPTVRETADHVRHAVSIDERRAKFKAALLAQDKKDVNGDAVTNDKTEDVKEVYFAGNHGDVGGGWGPVTGEPMPQRTKNTATLREIGIDPETYGAEELSEEDYLEANDPVQLSDIALEWMITELDTLHEPTSEENKADRIIWNHHKQIFLYNYYSKVQDAVTAPQHDMLKWGCGSSWAMFMMWKLLEMLPFRRLELFDNKWTWVNWPPNNSDTRDIPDSTGVFFHPSVLARMKMGYRPINDPYKPAEYHPHNTGEDGKTPIIDSTGWTQSWYRPKDRISEILEGIKGKVLPGLKQSGHDHKWRSQNGD